MTIRVVKRGSVKDKPYCPFLIDVPIEDVPEK
jgi:hypothetical protein